MLCAGLLFRALGPSECFGVKGFRAKWLLRVVGLPVVLSTVVALIYIQQRHSKSVGPSKAAKGAKAQMFMVIFFVSKLEILATVHSRPSTFRAGSVDVVGLLMCSATQPFALCHSPPLSADS